MSAHTNGQRGEIVGIDKDDVLAECGMIGGRHTVYDGGYRRLGWRGWWDRGGYRITRLRDNVNSTLRALSPNVPSPKSRNTIRRQEILLIDVASPAQALVKVRVRTDALLYVDYLAFHLLDEGWRITKPFYIDKRFGQQTGEPLVRLTP